MPDAPWEKAIIRTLVRRSSIQPMPVHTLTVEVFEIVRAELEAQGERHYKAGYAAGLRARQRGVDDHHAGRG